MGYPTGNQYDIAAAGYTATVTEVGATLRTLGFDGDDLLRGFPIDKPSSSGRGQHLIPWPNRIRDGRYEFGGTVQQLPLSEPARHNASHGLARWVPWSLVSHEPDRVVQRVVLPQQPGWPGTLEATITHAVGRDGLEVDVAATNVGTGPLPFGYGAHPYFTVGEQRVDQVTLTIPADSYLAVDDRLLPIDVVPVEGTAYDWRAGRPVGSASLDTAFTDLARDAAGRWQVTLARGDRRLGVWSDASTSWVQVFTGGPYRTISIAVEPMTCGPDAFNPGPTRAGLIVLQPGESTRCRWGAADLSERSR